MLHVSEEVYRQTKAEQEEFERLRLLKRRRRLLAWLLFRAWLSGALSLLALLAAFSPRWRVLALTGLASLPWFVWQVRALLGRERWLDRRLAHELADRRLDSLAERTEIRANLLEQKRAQDEIEVLQSDIEKLRNSR